MTNSTNISVIIPTHNRQKTLPNALDSVMGQSYKNFVAIIIDDGSTDNTAQIVQQYITRYPGMIRYYHQTNKGASAARNHGIKIADTPYLAFLDSDDTWAPQFLMKAVSCLDSSKYDWVIFDNYRVDITSSGEKKNQTVQSRGIVPTDANEILRSLLNSDFIGGPSKVVAKKECFEKAGCFDETLAIREDWELWLRFAQKKFRLGYINEPLYYYQVWDKGITRTKRHEGLICTMRVLDRYYPLAKNLGEEFKEIFATAYWDTARDFLLKDRDIWHGSLAIIKSQFCKPNFGRTIKSLKTRLLSRAQRP